MSVRQCQQEISSREFAEWIAYNRLEPFGERRADLRTGIVASVIANVNRDKKKRSKPFKAEEFMPEFGSEYTEYVMTPEETAETANRIFGQLAALQGQRPNG